MIYCELIGLQFYWQAIDSGIEPAKIIFLLGF